MLDNGYLFAFFDGLNRYYVRQEEAGLKDLIGIPVNVFDKFVSHGSSEIETRFAELAGRTDAGSLQIGFWIARRIYQVKRLLRVA